MVQPPAENDPRAQHRMIKLDLANLSAEELQRLVSERCSLYGAVERVSIVRSGMPYAIASVSMGGQEESQAVNRMLGELLVDNTVLIRIEQQ